MKIRAMASNDLFWIALLRILVGFLFLFTWWENIGKGFYTPEGLVYFFTDVFPQNANPLGWYAAFIDNVILPIRHIFAPVQFVGEFLMGAFLILGMFTRLTSLAALFFTLNTFLATYGHDWPWSYFMILGILLAVFAARAGRSLGVDAWLLERRGEPRNPLLW